MWIEASLDFDAGIDEAPLLLVAPGRGCVIGGPCQEGRLRHGADIGDRLPKRRADVADIAAKRDQGAGHQAFRVRVSTTPTSSKMASIGAWGLWTVTLTALIFGNAASTASATAPAARSSNL